MQTAEQSRGTILLVDDTAAQRYTVARILSTGGYRVVEAGTGAEALARVGTGIDMVLLDVALPDIDGFEVCRRLREKEASRETPVLHLSATYVDPDSRARGMELGADGYLTHPVHPRELLAVVGAILRSRRAEIGMKKASQQLAEMLESITDAFFALDSEWRITYFNKRAEEILGRKREQMLGRFLWDEYPEAVGGPFYQTYDRVLRTRRSDVVEAYYPPLDIWFDAHVYPGADGGISVYFQDVTQRRREQEALRASEEWLRLTTEGVGIGLWQRDVPNNRLVWTNLCKRMYGISEDEPMSFERLLAAVHPEDREAIVRKLHAVDDSEVPDYSNEYRVIWPDGTERWIHSRAIAQRDEQGRVVRLLGVALDLTERKQLESELAEATRISEQSLKQLRTVIENMAEGICVLDAEGTVLLTNRGFRDIFGYENTPHVPRGFARFADTIETYDVATGEFVPPGAWPASRVLRGESIRGLELRTVRSDTGKQMVLSYSGAPVYDEAGKVLMAVMTIQDVTALTEAERNLRASQQHLEMAQRSAQIGSFDWEIRTEAPIQWSEELQRIYGFRPGEWTGDFSQWVVRVHPDDLENVQQAIQSSILDGSEYQAEFRIRRADTGELRWIAARGQTYYDAEGNPLRMIGVNMDVTERKQAEDALRSSEKLAAAGRMAGTLAHEINNPMAAVTNLVYLLSQDKSLGPQARAYIQIAEQELTRVQHIIKNTLGFYRESAVPVAVDLREVLDSVLDLYSRKITDKSIAVSKAYQEVGSIYGFPGELRQVFSNVVVNALEALPEGGRIAVRMRRAVDPFSGAAGVRVIIADNGPGIPAELCGRIFEPFFTTKGEKGTGLGLWVSKGIVAKHEGSIRLRSRATQPYQGTSFIIFLPCESAVQGTRRSAATP